MYALVGKRKKTPTFYGQISGWSNQIAYMSPTQHICFWSAISKVNKQMRDSKCLINVVLSLQRQSEAEAGKVYSNSLPGNRP